LAANRSSVEAAGCAPPETVKIVTPSAGGYGSPGERE